jgi:hypothetical protein
MSLSLYGVPDGQQKGQSVWPCPSVYSPATALGSLSSVALSSAPASVTLTQHRKQDANYHRFGVHISSGFLNEATNTISSGFLREATGDSNSLVVAPLAATAACPIMNSVHITKLVTVTNPLERIFEDVLEHFFCE